MASAAITVFREVLTLRVASGILPAIFLKFGSHNFKIFTQFHDLSSVHTSQIGVVILVTPKQEVERKSEWFCGMKFLL